MTSRWYPSAELAAQAFETQNSIRLLTLRSAHTIICDRDRSRFRARFSHQTPDMVTHMSVIQALADRMNRYQTRSQQSFLFSHARTVMKRHFIKYAEESNYPAMLAASGTLLRLQHIFPDAFNGLVAQYSSLFDRDFTAIDSVQNSANSTTQMCIEYGIFWAKNNNMQRAQDSFAYLMEGAFHPSKNILTRAYDSTETREIEKLSAPIHVHGQALILASELYARTQEEKYLDFLQKLFSAVLTTSSDASILVGSQTAAQTLRNALFLRYATLAAQRLHRDLPGVCDQWISSVAQSVFVHAYACLDNSALRHGHLYFGLNWNESARVHNRKTLDRIDSSSISHELHKLDCHIAGWILFESAYIVDTSKLFTTSGLRNNRTRGAMQSRQRLTRPPQ